MADQDGVALFGTVDLALVARPDQISTVEAARIEEAIAASRSPATQRAYATAWRQWSEWCAGRAAAPLPAEPALLAAYLTYMADAPSSISKIDKTVAAISAEHLDHDLEDPTTHRGVKRVRAGLRRTVGVAPKHQAHPLTTDEVRRMVSATDSDSLRGLRDRALILLGYAAALRRSEIVSLRVDDLKFKPRGVVVRILRSKGDQEGEGQFVGVARGQHPETDPVAALRAWIDRAELPPNGPLFRPIAWSDRRVGPRALSAADVNRILVARAADVGLGDLDLSGHSLRAGHATTAAEHGVPVDRLARTTRHRNLATLAGYIRPAEVLADTSSSDLGL